jgi:hypothetical protein
MNRSKMPHFREGAMNEGWIVLGICLAFVLGAALPLISRRGTDKTPLPPRKETLRDWRNEK